MPTNVPREPEPGQEKCARCGAPVWRAYFERGTWRHVERAATTHNGYGGSRFVRKAGHVALTFPLPGSGLPIIAAIVRGLTSYRVHACPAFSATNFKGRKDGAA